MYGLDGTNNLSFFSSSFHRFVARGGSGDRGTRCSVRNVLNIKFFRSDMSKAGQ